MDERESAYQRHRVGIACLTSLISVAIRSFSVGESFWIDELHTAWTVADGWSEIGPRAAAGNQSALYFHGLWVWMRSVALIQPSWLAGGVASIEVVARLSSVLLTAGAAAWAGDLTCRITRSRFAGFAAGLMLAIEPNAIFFGTELRPYAVVMLVAVAAVELAWRMIQDHDSRAWWLLNTIVWLAAELHLTSLLTLGPLLIGVAIVCLERAFVPARRRQWTRLALTTSAWLIPALHLLATHRHTWSMRDHWASFGSFDSLSDAWAMWPWSAMVLVPAGGLVVVRLFAKTRPSLARETELGRGPYTARWLAAVGVGCAVMAMLVAAACSSLEIAPLWHRRYLIASLPCLAISFGALIGLIADQNRLIASLTMVIAVLGLASRSWEPTSLLFDSPCRVNRSENWREAVAYLGRRTGPNDRVWVDPGLIEQAGVTMPISDRAESEYLTFALRGPYRLPNDVTLVATDATGTRSWFETDAAEWLITRRAFSPGKTDASRAVFGRVRVWRRGE